MEIPISDTRKLVWTRREIQIHKYIKVRREPEQYGWKSYSYHYTINGALRTLYREGLAKNPAMGVDECMQACYDEFKLLEKAIMPYNFTVVEEG